MITIERTLTAEEEAALTILGNTEQQLANKIIRTMNSIIEDGVKRAKRKLVANKTLTELNT
jgi:hypothetical protein